MFSSLAGIRSMPSSPWSRSIVCFLLPLPPILLAGGRSGKRLTSNCERGPLDRLLVVAPGSVGVLVGDLDLVLFVGELSRSLVVRRLLLPLVIPPLVTRLLPPLPLHDIDSPALLDDGRGG